MPTPTRFRRNSPDDKRLLIAAVDGFRGELRAHFNPREVQLEKTVNWQEGKPGGSNSPTYEYTAGNARSLSMELLFDRFEVAGDTVEPELETLTRMSIALDPQSKVDEKRRPPHLTITNGPFGQALFRCVLESGVIKITMFDKEMRPVRATANVKFKELPVQDTSRPNYAGGRTGKRDGLNWTAPTDDELEVSRKEGRKERDRLELLQSLE
jgi:hypothetical protein